MKMKHLLAWKQSNYIIHQKLKLSTIYVYVHVILHGWGV